MVKKKILVSNWKMNGSIKEFSDYFKKISLIKLKNLDFVVAVPFVYIHYIKNIIPQKIMLSGQNIVPFDKSARTGDINAHMLSDIGCKFVIIGHSECRINNNLDNTFINKSVISALNEKLQVILCIGEDNESISKDFLIEQLVSALETIDIQNAKNIVIGYEPVYSIGTGIISTYNIMLKKINIIKATLQALNFNDSRIIYGGSVNEKNASELIKQLDIDGVLIGKASMNPDSMINLLNSVQKL